MLDSIGGLVAVGVGVLTLLGLSWRYVIRPIARGITAVLDFFQDLRDALRELRDLVSSFTHFVAETEQRLGDLEVATFGHRRRPANRSIG